MDPPRERPSPLCQGRGAGRTGSQRQGHRRCRRIRRRDGARNWALLRDLEHPDLWSESYHIATWDEYVRHNLRRTKADYETYRELHALHRGEHPPAVHRMIERHAVSQSDDLPLLGKLELP